MALQETNKNQLFAKSGGAPTTANVVALSNKILLSPKVKTGTSNDIGTGALAAATGYVDPADCTVEFNIEASFRSPLTLGAASEASDLFKIAGLAEVLTAATKAEYKLGGVTNYGTGQIKVHTGGFYRNLTGVSSSMEISGKMGELVNLSFAAKGVATLEATAEVTPAVTLNAGSKLVMSKDNTVVTVAGTILSIDDFKLDLGASVIRDYTSGTNGYYIEDFAPKLSLTFMKTLTTDENAWTQLKAGGTVAINITIGAAGNQLVIDAPYAFSESVDEQDSSGRTKMSRSFVLQNGNTSNANFTITLK